MAWPEDGPSGSPGSPWLQPCQPPRLAVPTLGTRAPSPEGLPARRFLDRDAPRGQSFGRFAVRRRLRGWGQSGWLRDPFHTVVHTSTFKVVGLFCVCICLTHLVFAGIYYSIDEECDLQIQSFLDSFYLSIEVGMTVGWGVPGSPYLKKPGQRHGCYSGAFFVLLHTLSMHVLSALLIGVLYSRVSRGTSRAASLCFSRNAVIREIGGKLYFMFQVCETRKHQLTEAKVRCYALVTREVGGAMQFEQRFMRLLHPSDELGGMLLLAVPALVVHEIDLWSPFCPEAKAATFPGLLRRAAEVELTEGGDAGMLEGDDHRDRAFRPSRAEVEDMLRETRIEVLALVEGEEPVTATAIQARHSYANEDIVFDCAFAPAVLREEDGSWSVCFDRFQELIPAEPAPEGTRPAEHVQSKT